ncbi:hypothetical protein Tco_0836061 [Tanacetum coccineum]
MKSKADRLANLDSLVKETSLVTYVVNGIRSKYLDAACVTRLREKAPTFNELQSMMLLEESDMSTKSVSSLLLHVSSSSPTVLVAPTAAPIGPTSCFWSYWPIPAGPAWQYHTAGLTRPNWLDIATMFPQAFQMMTLQQPSWNKDTEASSHLAENTLIMEYLVNISKRRAFWSLNEDILKITILKTNTPYPSRKIRRIRACTHQRPQRNEAQYAVSRRSQYAVLKI